MCGGGKETCRWITIKVFTCSCWPSEGGMWHILVWPFPILGKQLSSESLFKIVLFIPPLWSFASGCLSFWNHAHQQLVWTYSRTRKSRKYSFKSWKRPRRRCLAPSVHCACLDGLIKYEPVTHVAMQVYVILVQNIGGGGRDDVQYAIHPSLQSQ